MKNNLLKFGLLVLLAVFTFHSCSDDEQVISPKSVDSIKITIEDKIDNEELNNKIGQDLLKIRQAFQINTTNHKGENYQKKTENDSISIEDIEINIEAFNVIENENGKASYTFEVDFPLNNLDSQEIINLHFYYDENNQLKRQLIKYELSNEELQTVIENQSFDGFWDRISYSNLDDLETTPNSEKITAARSSDPCSCKSKKSTVKWKTPYSNNSGYGGYSSGTGGSGGQTPFSVIPISLQKLWGIAPASAYYPGPNYVGPTCNCNYTIPVRYFSVGDLTIPNTNSNSTPTPFNRSYFYYFPELKNKITTYYNQVYVSYINSYTTSTQTTLEDHNNKQRFITQFFKFLYKLRTENYSAFNYLANNPQKTVAVFNFLAENNSFNAYEFAKSAITALMNSGEVDWEELYINIEVHDDEYEETGQTSIIPNPLNLDNGDSVNLSFGTTKDGVNANQEVEQHLIDGLKFALNQANNNLTNKITDIYIMATTNGGHSSTSNHSRGSAIDISRINGQKMLVSGTTEQIVQLQIAFDNYQYIRENFGPHFKHKYSVETNTWDYNYPVGGHKDHIHISTRKNQ